MTTILQLRQTVLAQAILGLAWLSPLAAQTTPSADSHRPKTITKIAFGSCHNPRKKPSPMFKAVLAKQPDVFIFLGDNIYGDTRNMDTLKKKYQELEAVQDFRTLRKSTTLLATWDDHDFGVNDGGNTYPKRTESQKIFLDFFKEPKNSPRRKTPGIHTSYTFGEKGTTTQIILLDTRYFRDPLPRKKKSIGSADWYQPSSDTTKTLLGDSQWLWLEKQLQVPADLRIIASSIQLLAFEKGMENWGNVPHEQKRLFNLLRKHNIQNTITISGDVHFAELSKKDIGGYPFYDLTSSGLTNTHQAWANLPNSFRIGKSHAIQNAGLIEIDWAKKSLTLQIIDSKGTPIIDHAIPFKELEFK